MLRTDNSCIAYAKDCDSVFSPDEFIRTAKAAIQSLDETDKWIRSGIFINEKARAAVSSLQLFGSKKSDTNGESKLEALAVKLCIGVKLADAINVSLEFVCRYLLESGTDAALVAIVPPAGTGWAIRFVRSPRFCSFEIPHDIVFYMCSSALKNYLGETCGLNKVTLDACFSEDYVLFDDTVIRAKAHDIDAALRDIRCCDIASGSGQLVGAMANMVAERRASLNKYLGKRAERSADKFLRHYIKNSLYATDCDEGACESLKAEIRLLEPDSELNDKHIIWGNILTEDLFLNAKFDVIISNPPHIRQDDFSFMRDKLSSYQCNAQNADIYCYYTEQAFSFLHSGGIAVLLISNRWMRAAYGDNLRNFLSRKNIIEIIDYGDIPVLSGITVPMSVITAVNTPAHGNSVDIVEVDENGVNDLTSFAQDNRRPYSRVSLGTERWTFSTDKTQMLMKKIRDTGIPLDEYVGGAVFRGILTGLNKAFVIPSVKAQEMISRSPRCEEILRPFLSGRNVKRYAPLHAKKYLICIPKGHTLKNCGNYEPWSWFESTYQPVAEHLKQFEKKAEARADKGDFWWELRSFKHYEELTKPKIICPTIVSRTSVTMDTNSLFSNDRTSIIAYEDYYLLGLLNSRLMDFYFRHISSELMNGYYELKPADLSSLPIKKISETNSFSVRLRDAVATGGRTLLRLYAIPRDFLSDGDIESIRKTEREINNAVNRLYKLTHDEIITSDNY